MFTLQTAATPRQGSDGKMHYNLFTQEFNTKRELLDYLSKNPYSFIGRIGSTYTIYPKAKQ